MEERPWTKNELFAWNDGRRIVDLQELSKQLCCKKCHSLLDLRRTEKEMRYGLASVLYILCKCGVMNDVHTGKTQLAGDNRKSSGTMYEINIKASINLLMYGAGASRILNFLALLDIPVPAPDDTSLIVPVKENADACVALSAPSDQLTGMAEPKAELNDRVLSRASSFQKTSSLSLTSSTANVTATSIATFSSVPQPLAVSASGIDSGSEGSGVTETVQQEKWTDIESQKDRGKEIENQTSLYTEGSDDDDGDEDEVIDDDDDDDDDYHDGDDDDGGDDEYVPPVVEKPRTAPSPILVKRTSLRGTKNGHAKQTIKRAPQKRTTKSSKAKSNQKPFPEPSIEKIELKTQNQGSSSRELTEEKLDDPMDWSSTESEPDMGDSKESDGSWKGEEQEEEVVIEEERPKRGRGRPRGSTDKVKRTRRTGCRQQKEPAPKKGRAVKEATDNSVPKCTTCAKNFNSIKGYNLHMKRVHNQDMKERIELDSLILFVCAVCHMPYAREHRVISHLNMKHWSPTETSSVMFYKLPVTDFIQEARSQVCYKTARYACRHCSIDNMTRKTTGDHICISPEGAASCVSRCPQGKKLTQQDGSNLFHLSERCSLCYMCGAQFSDTVGLEHHLLSAHGQASKRLLEHKCDECGAMFPVQSRLDRHKAAKHTVGPRPKSYMCDFCGKAYPSKNTMFRHRQLKHISGERFQCEYCPKKFYKRHQWITHTKRHLGEAPHQCQVCGKDFSCKYNLKTHERIHTGEKPYQCQQCDAAFAQKTSLDVHMKKHQRQQYGLFMPTTYSVPVQPL